MIQSPPAIQGGRPMAATFSWSAWNLLRTYFRSLSMRPVDREDTHSSSPGPTNPRAGGPVHREGPLWI